MKSRIGKIVEYKGEEFITCQEVITFLLDYLSKDLDAEEERNFERHLEVCPSCVAYLQTYQQAVQLGREAMRQKDEEERPDTLGEDLLRAVLSARPRPGA